MISQHYQLAIIGSGPAGMAAARTAARSNLRVAVFDESASPGGQIYRGVRNSKLPEDVMGKDYFYGQALVEEFQSSKVDYFANASVWNIEKEKRLSVLYRHKSYIVSADWLIVATGAMERPVPFGGWTLPGVMHAGAGQIMLKQSGLLPKGKMVLAGTGPLLLLLASQYLKAGKPIEAVIDTTPKRNLFKAMPLLLKALLAPSYLLKGISLVLYIRRSGVKYYKQAECLEANGEDNVEAISFLSGGKKHTVVTNWLLTHFGVIPNQSMHSAIGCEQYWDNGQYCWRPVLDAQFNSSLEGIKIVGDGNGIGGAKSAEMEGDLAALDVSLQLGVISRTDYQRSVSPLSRKLRRDRAIRPFLEALYNPDLSGIENLPDDTLICRCEEVSFADIKHAISVGVQGINQLKAFTRCGMGACQGRQCGVSAAQIISKHAHLTMTEVGFYRPRTPLKPVTLGQLASLDFNSTK